MSKKNLEARSFKISMKLFPFDALVSYNQTDDEFKEDLMARLGKKAFKKEKRCMSELGSSMGYYGMLRKGGSVIRIKEFDPADPQDIGVLVHELSHFVHRVFENIGITWSRSSDETYSYTLEYLLVQCLTKKKE